MRQPDDTLSAVRYRIEDSLGRGMYVTIALDPSFGTPLELWVTVPEEQKPAEQGVRTEITTIAALFTEARQGGVPYTKLLQTMEGTIYQKSSATARILRLLQRHCSMVDAEAMEFENASQKEVAHVPV